MNERNKYKRIIVIQIDSVLRYPPTLRLLDELCKIGKEVFLITTVDSPSLRNAINKSVNIVVIGKEYKYSSSPLYKMWNLIIGKRDLWNAIDSLYSEDSLLWVMSNISLKHLGKRLLKYNYNIHLFELVEEVYYLKNFKLMKMGLGRYLKNANRVIVPEYNRAQITKTWFELKKMPIVIKNVPPDNDFVRNNVVLHSACARDLFSNDNRKIVLYQGIVDRERPIDFIAEAVEELDDYLFVVMTGSDVDYSRFKKTVVIPFVAPPFHLEITSHAYVGILMYQPVYNSFASPLNSIYCAPNKLFEYSQFGIPMIGNNIPGLFYSIVNNNCGVCFDSFDKQSIKDALLQVGKNYALYSKNAKAFFDANNNNIDILRAVGEDE